MGKAAVWRAGGNGSKADPAELGTMFKGVYAFPSYGNGYSEMLQAVDLTGHQMVFGVFSVNTASAGATAKASVGGIEIAASSYGGSAGCAVLVFSVRGDGKVDIYRGKTLLVECDADAVPVRLFCSASSGWWASAEFYAVG